MDGCNGTDRQQQAEGSSSSSGGGGGCKHSQAKKLGDVTTLNLTMLKAGVTGDGGETWNLNVIPVREREREAKYTTLITE